MKDLIKDLTVVSVDGKKYIGNLKKEGKCVTLSNASDLSKGVGNWFKDWNLGELIELSLQNEAGFSERSLTKSEKLSLKKSAVLMEEVKENAIAILENDLFDKMGDDE